MNFLYHFVVFLLLLDRKNNDNYYYDDDDDDDSTLNAGKHNRLNNDHQLQSLTQRRNRYPTHGGSSSNNYRSRSRWPSSYDDRYDLNDWSPYGHGHRYIKRKLFDFYSQLFFFIVIVYRNFLDHYHHLVLIMICI